MNAQGYSTKKIGEVLGMSDKTIYLWQKKMGLPSNHGRGMKDNQEFTIYDSKGNIRAFGKARECAEALGIKISSVYEMAARTKRTGKGNVFREELL